MSFFLPLKLINVSVNNNSNQTKIIMWHLLLTTVSNPIFAPSNVGSKPMYAVQIFFAGYVLIVNKVSIHKPKITKNYRGISCMHVIEVCRCVFQTNPVKNVFFCTPSYELHLLKVYLIPHSNACPHFHTSN